MIRIVAAGVFLGLSLSACIPQEVVKEITVPVEVSVPVDRPVLPPRELLIPFIPAPLPSFVAPGAQDASSCLSAEGEVALRALLAQHRKRELVLQRWAERVEPP